jgi:hypothetical protein
MKLDGAMATGPSWDSPARLGSVPPYGCVDAIAEKKNAFSPVLYGAVPHGPADAKLCVTLFMDIRAAQNDRGRMRAG